MTEIEYRDSLRGVLEQGRAEGLFRFVDVKVTAFAIITLCEYVHSWFNPRGPLSSSDVANQFADLVQQMVGTDATAAESARVAAAIHEP